MVECEAAVEGEQPRDPRVPSAGLVTAEVSGAGVRPAEPEGTAQARDRRQREAVNCQGHGDVGGKTGRGDVHATGVAAGSSVRGDMILDVDRLLLVGGDADGEGGTRFIG